MKKIKMIVLAFLMLGAFIYQGESFKDYMFYLPNNYISFTLSENSASNTEQTKETIKQIAENNNVELFTIGNVKKTIKRGNTETSIIEEIYYVTSPSVKRLLNKYYIYNGKYNTIFSGMGQQSIKAFSDIEDLNNIDTICCVSDNIDDIRKIQFDLSEADLVDDIFDTSPSEPIILKVTCVWSLIAVIYLLLTAYELAFERKKAAIKMSFGEDRKTLIFKNLMIDTAVIISEFIGIMLLANLITYARFAWDKALAVLGIMIVLSILVYLVYFKSDVRKAFSGTKSSRTLNLFNYLIKFSSGLIAIVLFSLNIGTIVAGIDKYNERYFFEHYKDYEYLGFVSDNVFQRDKNYNFYRDNFNYSSMHTLIDKEFFDVKSITDKDVEVVYLNRNAVKSLDVEIAKYIKEEKIYFLYPSFISKDKAQKSAQENISGILWLNDLNGNYKAQYETRIYDKNISSVAINGKNNVFKSQMVRNPIFIINNIDESKNTEYNPSSEVNITTLNSADQIMYNVKNVNLEKWLEDQGLNSKEIRTIHTGVYSQYLSEWELVKGTTVINSILTVLIILFQIFITKTIVRLEYSSNGKKLAIKTCMGYTRLQKFSKLWISGILVIIIGMITAFVFRTFFGSLKTDAILISTTVLLIIEIVVNLFYTTKIEKESLNKFIKGGTM